MIIERDFSYKNRDVNISLYDSFGLFGNIALPCNISWSKIGRLFSFSFRFICITFHVDVWNNGEENEI